MLAHLSTKFDMSKKQQTHEPRAALFLNRFTRTLTIMYATSGIEQILGISGEDMKGKSFYYCIQEDCLDEAVRCLESAKGNDSIAYLRFWFRDPRTEDQSSQENTDAGTETETDTCMTDVTSEASEDDWDERHDPRSPHGSSSNERSETSREQTSSLTDGTGSTSASAVPRGPTATSLLGPPPSVADRVTSTSRTSSGDESLTPNQTPAGVFEGGPRNASRSLHTSPPTSPDSAASLSSRQHNSRSVELEAIVSCTSDGLVVCLRRARPVVPTGAQQPAVHQPSHSSGIFAAPWASKPIFHPERPNHENWPLHQRTTRPSSMPGSYPLPPNDYVPPPQGPAAEDLFNSIRDTAIFAWALTGINGSLADYARNPKFAAGESQPPDGLSVWEGAKGAYGDDYFRQYSLNNGASGADRQHNGSDTVSVGTGLAASEHNRYPTPLSRNGLGPQ